MNNYYKTLFFINPLIPSFTEDYPTLTNMLFHFPKPHVQKRFLMKRSVRVPKESIDSFAIHHEKASPNGGAFCSQNP